MAHRPHGEPGNGSLRCLQVGSQDGQSRRLPASMSDQERTPEEAALEANLGVRFSDLSLLRLALTHRSYAFELGLPHDNERLEFLGDSILGVTITSEIYNRLPEAREGRLAKIRAATVSTKSLAKVAHLIDLGQAVRLGVGERKTGGSTKPSILADTMEAVIGALYLNIFKLSTQTSPSRRSSPVTRSGPPLVNKPRLPSPQALMVRVRAFRNPSSCAPPSGVFTIFID